MSSQLRSPGRSRTIGHRIIANGFVPLIPILLWNVVLASRLPPEFSSDENLAQWHLILETILRIAVFVFPLFLRMRLQTLVNKVGLALYLVGALLYFGAWLVVIFWPDSTLAVSPIVVLAPYYMPLVFFTGVGLMGNSRLYIGIVVLFTIVHTYHGLLSFGYVS